MLCGINVSAEEESFAKIRDIYMPETLIVNPPTVVQMIDTSDKLNALKNEVRPQCAWLRLSEQHNVIISDATVSLTDALDACCEKVIPIIEIPNEIAAQYVIKTVKDQYYDLIFASMDTEVLELMNDAAIPYSRLAYISDSQNPTEVAQKALSCGAMIVVQKQCVRNNAEYFQQRFLTVMLMPEAENDELAVRAAVDVGANFVVMNGFEKAYEMYAAVTRVSYIRKGYIVGHRCMVSTAPENTVEGLHEAFQNGADAVEIDIWRTTDDRLVCFHNNYLTGSTTVESPFPTKLINEYSLEELQAFNLKQKGEYFDCKIPTLDQMFEALKEYPDKMIVIEIKDFKKTGELVHALMEEYGVTQQCVFISFGGNYLQDQREFNPAVGTSLLTSATWEDPKGYVDHYYHYTVGLPASYSPSKSISVDGIRQLHARGVGVNLWTAYRLGEMTDMAYHGAQFITTDVVEEESSIRPFYTRMSADEVFGRYAPPVEEKPFNQTAQIIIIASVAMVLCAGAAVTVFMIKRKQK
jgi:glycerophosphoryl diester phosphodiesterase